MRGLLGLCALCGSGFVWHHGRIGEAVADLARRRGLEGFFRPPVSLSVGVRGWVPEFRGAEGGR